jgi:hypothetical protein
MRKTMETKSTMNDSPLKARIKYLPNTNQALLMRNWSCCVRALRGYHVILLRTSGNKGVSHLPANRLSLWINNIKVKK